MALIPSGSMQLFWPSNIPHNDTCKKHWESNSFIQLLLAVGKVEELVQTNLQVVNQSFEGSKSSKPVEWWITQKLQSLEATPRPRALGP